MPSGHLGRATSICHPPTPMAARGLCKRCYEQAYRTRSPARYAAKRTRGRERHRQLSKAERALRYRRGKLARYKLTPLSFDALLRAQGSLCALCHLPMEKPVIDHDHISGRVRGLVHRFCNIILGYAEKHRNLLRRSQEYLQHATSLGQVEKTAGFYQWTK